MNTQIMICLVIFACAIVCFGLNKWNMGVVAMLMMAALIISGCVEPAKALSNFSNNNVIVMGSMMVIAAGFGRTQLVTKLSDVIYKIGGGSFDHCLRLFLLMAFVLIPFAGSPLARMAIFYPILTATCDRCGISPAKGMFPLGLVGLICNIGLPIGNGAITYINLNTYLDKFGANPAFRLTVLDPFKAKIVPGLIMLAYCLFIAPRLAPDSPPVPIEGMDIKEKAARKPLTPFAEKAGYIIFILNTLGILFAGKLGIPEWLICIVSAAMMHACGVLSVRDVRQALPLNMLLLLVGCMTLGDALIGTGAGQLIGDSIVNLLGGSRNSLLIYTVFFLIPFAMTQFMNNAGAGNICRPIIILVCNSLGANPMGPILLLSQAQMNAFLTPMATTSIPVMMAAGGYDQKSLLKQGWLPAVLCTVVNVLWISFLFPLWP